MILFRSLHTLLRVFFLLACILPSSAYSVSYSYDVDHRLSQVVLDNGETILYLYDKVGNRQAVLQGNLQYLDLTTQLNITPTALSETEPGIWEQILTLKNTSGSLIQSNPLILLIRQLPADVNVLNAQGSYLSLPFFLLDNVNLIPNGQISQPLRFRAPSVDAVNYTVSLYAVQ